MQKVEIKLKTIIVALAIAAGWCVLTLMVLKWDPGVVAVLTGALSAAIYWYISGRLTDSKARGRANKMMNWFLIGTFIVFGVVVTPKILLWVGIATVAVLGLLLVIGRKPKTANESGES